MQKKLDQKNQLETFTSFFDIDEKKLNLLKDYVNLLLDSQKSLNLISSSTVNNIWIRHILDSAQIYKFLTNKENSDQIIDIGSGSGLPGIVLAVLGINNILLCEKSPKKSNFLKKVLDKLKINETIFTGTVESISQSNTKYIIARAFKPLPLLLEKTIHLINKDTVLILHKGKNYREEIKLANKIFHFSYSYYDSITSKEGKIIKIESIKRINV